MESRLKKAFLIWGINQQNTENSKNYKEFWIQIGYIQVIMLS